VNRQIFLALLYVSCLVGALCNAPRVWAQTFGTVRGTILDPSEAVITNATVEIQNPVAHYTQTTKTNGQGQFEFNNVPFNNYHLSVTAAGFQTGSQDIDVRSGISLEIKVALMLGTATTEVQVQEAADLVEVDPITHTDVDRGLFDKLPLESTSSSLSSLVTLASPGVSADSNGMFHGLGDHAENSFSVDGRRSPINRARFFRTRYRSMPSSPWKSLKARRPRSMATRRAWLLWLPRARDWGRRKLMDL
jgi:hypothetical protein